MITRPRVETFGRCLPRESGKICTLFCILVCTDAASEGLNLQAAGALINFDLPWNPSKVEQRIGRIDRIGQELPVLPVVNLYLKHSVDERVYRALASRCGLFDTNGADG